MDPALGFPTDLKTAGMSGPVAGLAARKLKYPLVI